MMPEIKLAISSNDKVIHTVNKEISSKGLVKAIQEFQIIANTAITKLIEDSGHSGDCIMEEDAEDNDNDDEDLSAVPKKKKK